MSNQEAIANLNMISVAFVEPVTKEQRKLINDTFDEAIKALVELPKRRKEVKRWRAKAHQIQCEDAISRADVLEAISELNSTTFGQIVSRTVEKLPPVNPQPCGDAISRQATIEAFQMFRGYESNRTNAEWVDRIESVVKALPPVTPQQKTGYWIMPQNDDGMSDPICYQVRCSECGFDLDPQTYCEELERVDANGYCPKCGAKMVGHRKVRNEHERRKL